MLRPSALRPRKQNSRKADADRRFPSHLKWLRGRRCVLDGHSLHQCDGRIEAAHFDGAGGKGMGIKVADYHAFPACTVAHAELHNIGQDSWQAKYRINLEKTVRAFAKYSPHRHLWEAKDD